MDSFLMTRFEFEFETEQLETLQVAEHVGRLLRAPHLQNARL